MIVLSGLRALAPAVAAVAALAACGTHAAIGGGLGAMHYAEEGGAGSNAAGPMLSLRLAVPDSGFRGMLAADLTMFTTGDPGTDARSRSLIILPSMQQTSPGGSSFRIGVGPALSFWSGDPYVSSFGGALAAGAALTLDLRRKGRQSWSLEFSATGALAPDVAAALGGIHVVKYFR